MKVLIDPGHSPGSANRGRNGYREYAGMWKLSNYLKDILMVSGVGVALTRTEYSDPAIETRGGMACGADLFISEHSNAYNGAMRGVECFHSVTYPNDRIIAAKLTAAVSAVMGNPDRGAKTRAGSDGKDYCGVIRAAADAGCPQVFLIENGFHDNEQDESFLLADENLKRIAQAQAQVILETSGVKKDAVDPGPQTAKHPIMGASVLTAAQLAAYLLAKNPYPKLSISCTALELAEFFVSEGRTEGIRGDMAFCQSIFETGWFKFGGQILPEQYNYGGLGSAWFMSPQLGVRAQIQHLKAYANTAPLKQDSVDPGLHLVSRGTAPCWEDLNGRWAIPGSTYGQTVIRLYEAALEFVIKETAPVTGPAPELIIDTLLDRVEIASPDYWVNVLKGREQVNIKYLNTLFARFAGFDV